MNVRAPETVEGMAPARRAAMHTALTNAVQRARQWGLPELAATQPRTRVVGWLTRDRAMVIIERDLVNLAAQRRRRAPWGDLWAPDWWEQVILPAAAAQRSAAWWARRAPRSALEWASLLDPSSVTGAGNTGSEDERGT